MFPKVKEDNSKEKYLFLLSNILNTLFPQNNINPFEIKILKIDFIIPLLKKNPVHITAEIIVLIIIKPHKSSAYLMQLNLSGIKLSINPKINKYIKK